MGIFTKPAGYAKQITAFLKNKKYTRAYNLSKEMVEHFPEEMASHFLLAKCAFWMKKYKESAKQGEKAFKLAKKRGDLRAAAILTANALFMTKEYQKGYRLVKNFEKDKKEEVEKMLLMFAALSGDEKKAGKHAAALLRINKKAGIQLLKKLITS